MYYYIFSRVGKIWAMYGVEDPITNKEEAVKVARRMAEGSIAILGKDIKVMELSICARDLKNIKFREVKI